MKKLGFLLLIIVLFVASSVNAETGIRVKATKGFDTTLEVIVGDPITIEKTKADGKPVVKLWLPNSSLSYDKGAPELPRLTAMVMLDNKYDPVVKVVKAQAEIINLEAPVIPSKGNFTRNIDPSTVPYEFGPIYSENKWYPSDDKLVVVGQPFIYREVRGINLVVTPVQYNPVKNQLKIYRNFTISISHGKKSTNPITNYKGISRTFEPLYRRTFINFRHVASKLPRLPEFGKLLVICYDDFVDAVMPLVTWKKKCGWDVKLVKLNEILKSQEGINDLESSTTSVVPEIRRDIEAVAEDQEDQKDVVTATAEEGEKSADKIKAFIQKEYDTRQITHIILVGDAEQIPTLKGVKERADSDPCYTKLVGNDHVHDAIISRISATTKEEVAYQVAKFINYEAYPITDNTEWYSTGTGIASNEGKPKDWEYMDKNRDALLKAMFKSIDRIYDPGATKDMVAKAVNEGRSLINYLGHGSGTSWGTTRFSNSDINQLKNGWKMPIIWDVACVNGRFVNFTGFGETWMRAGNIDSPAGAVSYAGSTTNMEWVPPIWVQVEFNQNYIANEVYKTTGGIFANGIMKGLELYGTDPKGSGVMMLEQWHLFGDCTMLVRFKPPKKVKISAESTKQEDKNVITVKVVDEEGKSVQDARVVAYTEGVENVTVNLTDHDGNARVTLPADAKYGYVTVVSGEIVPIIDHKIELN